jgi:hypothetical protein
MPDAARPLELDDAIRNAIGSALASGNVVTVAYNGDDGWPHVSRRGSTHVYGPQQLAIWVRKRGEGLAKAIEERPQITLFYVDLLERHVGYTFYGLGRVSSDAEESDRVWDGTPDGERDQDPERDGVPLIIDLERVVAQGVRPEDNFVMERSTS